MPFKTIGPGRIEYERIDVRDPDVPTIVMLHEGLGSLSMWRDFPGRLGSATRSIIDASPSLGGPVTRRRQGRATGTERFTWYDSSRDCFHKAGSTSRHAAHTLGYTGGHCDLIASCNSGRRWYGTIGKVWCSMW
jgi:hypothetical protein